MTDQEINRAIAEALTAQGFAEDLAWKAVVVHASCKARDRLDETHWNPPVIMVEKGVYRCGVTGPTWVCNGEIEPQDVELIPRDFLDPRYLGKAVDAYCDNTGNGYTVHRCFDPADGVEAVIYAGPLQDWTGLAEHGQSTRALRNAFAAALGVTK